jgi:hypothetical protein
MVPSVSSDDALFKVAAYFASLDPQPDAKTSTKPPPPSPTR